MYCIVNLLYLCRYDLLVNKWKHRNVQQTDVQRLNVNEALSISHRDSTDTQDINVCHSKVIKKCQ